MKRFTIRETSRGFVVMDGGNTMEDAEVQAESLNLLDRIAVALEQKDKPGETLRRTRREEIERAIGQAEAAAARQRAMKIGGGDGHSPEQREIWARGAEDRGAFLRAELARLDAEPPARNPQSGVILTEFLVVLAVTGLLIGGAAAAIAGSVAGLGLVAALALGGIYLWPLFDGLLAPSPPSIPASVRPVREVGPLTKAEQQTLCALEPGQIPVEVRRLNAPQPPRVRRTGSSGPHRLPRRERGVSTLDVLCIFGCAAVAVLMCVAALLALR